MTQILLIMLQTLESQTKFIAQLAGDVVALKNTVYSLDERALPIFEQQAEIAHGRFEREFESRQREFETLRQLIFQMPKEPEN
jgi:hypothetical protein